MYYLVITCTSVEAAQNVLGHAMSTEEVADCEFRRDRP